MAISSLVIICFVVTSSSTLLRFYLSALRKIFGPFRPHRILLFGTYFSVSFRIFSFPRTYIKFYDFGNEIFRISRHHFEYIFIRWRICCLIRLRRWNRFHRREFIFFIIFAFPLTDNQRFLIFTGGAGRPRCIHW